ncbi:putative leucine-rich repeat receptor-like protein kinase [Dorcoceras hygrometricum]|uniref:Putative leucine-rich repeat receptor-like protein kinase n=1 Tax=Dorcoceras hygrometricum TaxID=472368 RepID=A0A2Z6ZZR1_9LAMI|nr:putative leucine-rich repeat receptor-like protein kinase [Dorcoceras hygrometricum]
MPPRRCRSRIARQTGEESRAPGSDEDVEQQSIPLRRRDRHKEVDDVTRQIGEMELVMDRFQRMNPPTFTGTEGGLMAEGWLEHMEELFDAVEYS